MEEATTKPPLVAVLGGARLAVNLPRRHAERRELATTWVRANLRGAAAILAVTVPALELLRAPGRAHGLDPAAFGYDWFEFGAEALDRLLEAGYDENELLAASVPIFNAIAALLPPARAEVEGARDF
jgi:hypothetical protein